MGDGPAGRGRAGLWALAALVCLAGCAPRQPAAPAAGPGEDLWPVVQPPQPRPPGQGSPDEQSLAALYADMQGDLIASGRMRVETDPPDVPFTLDDLIRNFERIALMEEYVAVGGRYVHTERQALLRRWARPVRVGVVVGPSVPPEEAAQDKRNVAEFTARLARLTGLDMQVSEGSDVNFLVTVLSSEEQSVAAQVTSRQFPGFHPAVLDHIGNTPLDTFCTAYSFGERAFPSAYAVVMIVIRAEHPLFFRASCLQEEMAQAMGLTNDSPDARPSLFNANLEFAFLTDHDEILLRMLYDPRLRPGMTLAEVRPLLPAVARDAMAAQAAARGQIAAQAAARGQIAAQAARGQMAAAATGL